MDSIGDLKQQGGAPPGKVRIWLQRSAGMLSVGYSFVLICLFVLFRTIGEEHWILSVLVLVPPQLWLLPTLLLAFVCWRLQRRWFWLNCLTVLLVVGVFVKFHWSTWSEPKGKTLSILTNNIGGRKTRTVWPFIGQEKPDVILYQDAWHHARNLSRENPGKFVASHGQFCIISNYEVKRSGTVPGLTYRHNLVAAWFELDFHGTPVVIYNIHMPTPRPDLNRLRARGLVAEIVGRGGIYSAEVREQFKESLEARNKLTRDLLAWLEKEKRPVILAGDFNAPSIGATYRRIAAKYEDAFSAEGRGFGFTFPSMTRNPTSLFGPWMRLDYIFADKHWQPVYCRVEPRQPSEHRAVSARFVLKDQK